MMTNATKPQAVSSLAPNRSELPVEPGGRLNQTPFRWTQREAATLPVSVEGRLPAWLRGDLVRTAPALFEAGSSWRAKHWFDALGIIYGFSFADGVVFKQRLLESAALRDAQSERPRVATFDTPAQRTLWQRLIKPIPQITDNANVNIVPWQGAWLAMTESPHQHLVDRDSLASRGLYTYDDKLPAAALSAHPHFDFERKSLVNIATSFGPKNVIRVYSQSADSRTRKVEGELALKRVPYLHSFGLTSRHAVIIDHPFTLNPLKLLFSNRGFIDPFEWQPERGTRLWKLDRATGKWSAFETDPFFCFHTVNCYEDGDEVVLDFVAYDDAGLVKELKTTSLDRTIPELSGRYLRARLRPGRKHAELESLSERGFEFPSIPYRASNGRPYDVVWGARVLQDAAGTASSELLRVEPARGEVAAFSEPGMIYGEPVFVPRPDASRTDDGVLLSVGSDAHRERTTLAILDAQSLAPVAHAHVNLCLPLGFHGNFQAAY